MDEKFHLRHASTVSETATAGDSPRSRPEGTRPRLPGPLAGYSHSIVDGGFDVMSSTTLFTAGTSLTIRDEIVSSRS